MRGATEGKGRPVTDSVVVSDSDLLMLRNGYVAIVKVSHLMDDRQENIKCYQMHKKKDAPAVIRSALTHHQNRTLQLGGAMV